MNQTVSVPNGVGSLLSVAPVPGSAVAGAVSTASPGAMPPSFGDSLRQAQHVSVADRQDSGGQASSVSKQDGQNLPGSGQLLPAGVAESAETAVVQVVADAVAEVAVRVDERSRLQQLSSSDSAAAQASDESGDDTLRQIDQYRRADLAVAVDSALKQLAGVAGRAVGNADSAGAKGHSVASAATAASFESQWMPPTQAESDIQAAHMASLTSAAGLEKNTTFLNEIVPALPVAGGFVSGGTESITLGETGDSGASAVSRLEGRFEAAGAGGGQSSAAPLSLSAAVIKADDRSPVQSGLEPLMESNAASFATESLARQEEVVANDRQLHEMKSVTPAVQNLPVGEIAAQAASAVQSAVRSADRDVDSVVQNRSEKGQGVSVTVEGLPLTPSQESNKQQPARQPNDVLLTQTQAQAQAQSATATPQSLAQSQLDGQLSADSIREKLKAVGAESDKTSVGIESAVRSEGRQESQLTSFADSLAAASRGARPMQEVSQLTMPHGAKPGEPAWSQAVNDRVMVMASKNGQFADIKLDPPELGSLQVRLHLKNDQVSVVFNTPHASVREALEQNMPRLREMFADQGLNMSDSSVEDHSRGQQRDESGSGGSSFASYQGDVVDEGRVDVVRGESLSLVDYYA